MAFDKYTSPVLPIPPVNYDRGYFSSLIGVLNQYFRVSDSKAPITIDSLTSKYLRLPATSHTASNGSADDVTLSKGTFVRITGPTAAFTFTGIVKGVDGEIRVLFNSTAQNMTIANESASSTAENRVITNTGADITTTGTGVVVLLYSVNDSRWVVVSSQL